MSEVIIFLLVCYGATNIMVFGSIFDRWRTFWLKVSPNWFGKLFTCPMCLSTWWGFIISYIFILCGVQTPLTSIGITIIPLAIFLDGLLASGGVWLIHTIQEYFEKD